LPAGALAKEGAAGLGAFGEFVGDGVSGFEGVIDHRLKVHKPAFEERLRHPFQRRIHPPIQLNLVIQGAQDVSDRLGSYALASQIAHDDRLKQPLRRYGLTSADPGKVLEGFCQSHRYEETGISWAEWLNEYRDPWFSNIFSQIRADLASYLPSTRRFIVCGGGAHLVAHKLKGNDAFVVMPQPNFSNVVGMYEQFSDRQLAIVA